VPQVEEAQQKEKLEGLPNLTIEPKQNSILSEEV
jgi:hypothetical protein